MAVVLLAVFLFVGLLLLLSNKEKFLTYFFFLYPILPEYFAVSVSDSLPLFTASRLLFLMLLVVYLLKKKKISYGILKIEGLRNLFLLLIVGGLILQWQAMIRILKVMPVCWDPIRFISK